MEKIKTLVDLSNLNFSDGSSLDENPDLGNLFLVLVRHSGCTFCRETVFGLAQNLKKLANLNYKPILVHMGPKEDSSFYRESFRLGDLEIVSDPKKVFYKAFGARRGNLLEVLSPKVIWRGVASGALKKHGIGSAKDDVFQLGGIYSVENGEAYVIHRPKNAADGFDWSKLP